MVRSFLAIEPSSEVRGLLAGCLKGWSRLSLPVRWVRPELMHVTMRFFGDLDEAAIGRAIQAVESVAESFESFRLELASPGAFPSPSRARVLWVGFRSCPEIGRLHSNLEQALEANGLGPGDGRFHPHLTVGRVKRRIDPARLRPFFQTKIPEEGFAVSELVLFRSDLRPDGPRYSPIRRFPLA